MAPILTLNNFVFNCKRPFQKLVVPCVGYAHHCLQLSSWTILKRNIYAHSFKEFRQSTYDSLVIYFSYGLVVKSNSRTVWMTSTKNTIPSSLKIKYHKLASLLLIQNSLFKVTKMLQKSIGKARSAKTSFNEIVFI